MTHHVRTFIYW